MPEAKREFELSLDKFMDELVDEIFSRSQENLVKNGSIDTGEILKRANVNREFLSKEIVYESDYAGAIEFGSDPHEVPVEEIPNPRRGKNTKRTVKVPVLYDWTRRKLEKNPVSAVGVSWRVKRKIARKGTRAQPFLRPAIDETIMRMGGSV